MRIWTIAAMTLATALTAGAGPAVAQTGTSPDGPAMHLSATTGWSSLWDDETMLGRGVPLGGGIGWLFGDRLLLSAEAEWFHHTRDSGYLSSKGDRWTGSGRAEWLFGDPAARVRASAGAGIGVMRSTGTLTFRSLMPGQPGGPVQGPDVSTPWSATTGLLNVTGGVRIALSPRVAMQPEARWQNSIGSASHSGIEPPFLSIGALVRVDVELD